MACVASQLIEEVTVHAQSESLEDAREICADGTYVPNNLRMYIAFLVNNAVLCISAPLSIIPVLWFFVPAAGLGVRERMSKYGCFTGSFVNNVAVKIEEAWQVDCEIKNTCGPAWLIYSPFWFLSSVLVATVTCNVRSLDVFHVWKNTVK